MEWPLSHPLNLPRFHLFIFSMLLICIFLLYSMLYRQSYSISVLLIKRRTHAYSGVFLFLRLRQKWYRKSFNGTKIECGSVDKKKSPRIWRLLEFFSFRNQMIQVFNPFYISLLIRLILI